MSLTDLQTRAKDGAYRPDEEAGLLLNCLVYLADDRRPLNLADLETQLAAVTLEAPYAAAWVAQVRELGEEDDPDARALAAACTELIERRDDLRPDQWEHLVGCIGAVWCLLERLEPFLMGTVRAGVSPAAPSVPALP